MKKTLWLFLILLIGSCGENEERQSSKPITSEALSQNEKFQEIISLSSQLAESFGVYLDGLDEADRKNQISKLNSGEIQLADLYHELGYTSRSDFDFAQNERANLTTSLSKEFGGFKEMNSNELVNLFIDSEKIAQEKKIKNKSAKPDYCSSTLQNCKGSANAVLALETTACVAGVFVPFVGVVLGPACEVAALTHHYYSTRQCDADYQNCQQPQVS